MGSRYQLNSDCPMDPMVHRTSEFTIGQIIFRWTFKTSYYKYELRQLLLVCAAIKRTRI